MPPLSLVLMSQECQGVFPRPRAPDNVSCLWLLRDGSLPFSLCISKAPSNFSPILCPPFAPLKLLPSRNTALRGSFCLTKAMLCGPQQDPGIPLPGPRGEGAGLEDPGVSLRKWSGGLLGFWGLLTASAPWKG